MINFSTLDKIIKISSKMGEEVRRLEFGGEFSDWFIYRDIFTLNKLLQ